MGISFGCNKVNKSIPTTPKEAETTAVDKFYSNKENNCGCKSAKLIENSDDKDKTTVDPIMADSNIEKQVSQKLFAQNGSLVAPDGTTLKEAFEMLDKDRTGRLTVEALSNFMNSLNVQTSKENLKSLMRSLDTENRGYLDYSQFVTLVDNTRKFTIDYKRRMEMAFNTFDKNGDGYISLEELNCTMRNLGEILSSAELDQMMQFADLNKDGKINAEEFEALWKKTNDC